MEKFKYKINLEKIILLNLKIIKQQSKLKVIQLFYYKI